jgi:hypothetical protein
LAPDGKAPIDAFGQNYTYAAQSAVPISSAVWLFGGALGALGVLRRKSKPAA